MTTLRRHDFRIVDADLFRDYFELTRIESKLVADATSPFSHSTGTLYYLSTSTPERGVCGYAIRPDGDLVFVFSSGRGNGAEIVDSALGSGAETLDCFDGYLPTLYARHGFVEYAREANWTPGEPDVVFMALPHRLADLAS